MKTLEDSFGNMVRLTDERMAHIIEHPEMRGMETDIEQTLRRPTLVRRSRSDEAAQLFHDFRAQTLNFRLRAMGIG
jgi:hypothetical protein